MEVIFASQVAVNFSTPLTIISTGQTRPGHPLNFCALTRGMETAMAYKYKRQGATLSMSKFREIIRLHELGHNKSEIARSCLIARSTVRDYLHRAQRQSLSFDQLGV